MAKGRNTLKVTTSCNILSCASERSVNPIRFAGTWNIYSSRAMPQLKKAAIYQGLSLRFFRWAYQAKVIKIFDIANSRTVFRTTGMYYRF